MYYEYKVYFNTIVTSVDAITTVIGKAVIRNLDESSKPYAITVKVVVTRFAFLAVYEMGDSKAVSFPSKIQ